jgi:hypothetical protein
MAHYVRCAGEDPTGGGYQTDQAKTEHGSGELACVLGILDGPK